MQVSPFELPPLSVANDFETPLRPAIKEGQRVRVEFGTQAGVKGRDTTPFYALVIKTGEDGAWVKREDYAASKKRKVAYEFLRPSTSFESQPAKGRLKLNRLQPKDRARVQAQAKAQVKGAFCHSSFIHCAI